MSNYTAPASPSTTPAGAPPEATGASRNGGGGPYPPTGAQLGGSPSIMPDIPISAVFLGLFVIGAATNMTIFQLNQKRSYKFLFSVLLFGFCMARIVALTMRIVWATRPRDVNVGIASQIFTAAGVLILFVTNLIFAQRIIRAYHPFFGWSRGVTYLFRGLFASVVAVLIMVITVTVQSFFTLDPETRRTDRSIQLFAATYLAVCAFLPVPLVTLAAVVPRRTRIDKFGEGHFRTKFALLTFTATLLATGATFRAAVNYFPRPVTNPAWYHGKVAYYCFNFLIELVVVFTYALTRFDRRFHIPDGSSAPGHYSCSTYAGGRGGRGSGGGGGGGGSDISGILSASPSGGHYHRQQQQDDFGMSMPASESDERSSCTYDKVNDVPVRRSRLVGGGGGGGGGWPMRSEKRASTIKSVRSSSRSVGSCSGSMYSSIAAAAAPTTTGQHGHGKVGMMAAPLPPPSVHGDDGYRRGKRGTGPSESDAAASAGMAMMEEGDDYDEASGATRAEDLAWMSRALVSSFSPEFDVPRLRRDLLVSPSCQSPPPSMSMSMSASPSSYSCRLDHPLPKLPPAPPPREYPPLLSRPPLLEPDEGYGYGWYIWPVHESPEGAEHEQEDEQGERDEEHQHQHQHQYQHQHGRGR